jgi:hypothetical protein
LFMLRDCVDKGVFQIGMKWSEDGLHGFVSTAETFASLDQYEIAVVDWQGRDGFHHEGTKDTKFGNLLFRNLRALRAFVVRRDLSSTRQLIANAQAKH